MWQDKRVFVSGGNGVIGKELVHRLAASGAVCFVGDLKSCSEDIPPGVLYRQGDLNYITLPELELFSPEYFFHLAATFERSVESYEFWEENFWHNVKLSNHLMTLLKDCESLKRIVFASSYLTYDPRLYQFDQPQKEPRPLIEKDQVLPRNLTGMAKLQHELELRFLDEFRHDRLKSVVARIFRVYGKGSRDIISRWTRMLLRKEELEVFRPENIFDFIYARDVARGLELLALSEAEGVVNLGSGKTQSISNILEIFKRQFPDMSQTALPTDIPFESSLANMQRFKSFTDWVPSTLIEDGIPLIIEYERQHPEETPAKATGILVTSCSKKVPLIKAVRTARNKIGWPNQLVGADSDSECLGRYFVDDFWHMPNLDDIPDEDLLNEILQRGIRAVIPTRDGELQFWSHRKEWFAEQGVEIMISKPETVETCFDKLNFHKTCRDLNIPTIPTAESINELTSESFVVKERFGSGSRTVMLDVSVNDALIHARTLKSPIFQPFISGKEFSVDAYIDLEGRVKGIICRTRDTVISGESQVTTTVLDNAMESRCAEYLKKLYLYGHVIMQLIQDNSGQIHLIECNPRFGGASTLSLAAGLDSFYWFLLETEKADLDQYSFFRTEKPLRQIRHPHDLVVEWF